MATLPLPAQPDLAPPRIGCAPFFTVPAYRASRLGAFAPAPLRNPVVAPTVTCRTVAARQARRLRAVARRSLDTFVSTSPSRRIAEVRDARCSPTSHRDTSAARSARRLRANARRSPDTFVSDDPSPGTVEVRDARRTSRSQPRTSRALRVVRARTTRRARASSPRPA